MQPLNFNLVEPLRGDIPAWYYEEIRRAVGDAEYWRVERVDADADDAESQPEADAGEPQPDAAAAGAEAPHGKIYRQVKSWQEVSDYIGDIARRILGTEIHAESTRETLRFGHNRGSIAVEIDGPKKGTWYDHTTSEGGGVLQLIIIKGGVAKDRVADWLADNFGIEIEGHKSRRRIVASYIYRDEKGVPLAKKDRWEPKNFSWKRADGAGGWKGKKDLNGERVMDGVRRLIYRLPEVTAAPADAVVYWVEGEKDADAGAARLGLITTCNPDGGSAKSKTRKPAKWRPEFGEQVGRRNIVVIPDNDEVGLPHARTVSTQLARAGCAVRIVTLPHEIDGLKVKDLSDWIEAGGTLEQLEALVADAPVFEYDPQSEAPQQSDAPFEQPRKSRKRGEVKGLVSPRGLPVIEYAGGKLAAATDKAERILAESDHEIFQRSDFLVRLGTAEDMTAADGEIVKGPRLVTVGAMHLQDRLNRVIEFMKFDERLDDFKPINPPRDVAEALRQRVGLWKHIQVIDGIASAPVFRTDGTIIDQPGFDPSTRIYYAPTPGVAFNPISPEPTKDQARGALDILCDLIGEFPFIQENGDLSTGQPSPSRSVALSGLMTPMVRRAILSAPIHGFDATEAGSGKSKLCSLPSIIARGHAAPVIPGGTALNPEEFEKKISTSLIGADAIVVIDNVEGRISSELLCSAATERMLYIRVLGLSKHILVPNGATFFINGNGLTIVGDLVRRSIRAGLDPKIDRPELRTFAQDDPVLRAMRDRPVYVAAILTILCAFHVAGRPKQTEPLGSFEDWSRLVRDALIWLGEPDPCETMERTRKQDPRRKSLADIVYWWDVIIGRNEVTAKRVIEYAEERVPPKSKTDFNPATLRYPEFREALMAIAAGKTGNIDPQRLGQWLGRNQMRFVDGLRIEPGLFVDHSGSSRWKVVSA